MVDTSNKLLATRTRRGLTQEQLAVKAGVSRQTINAIERGRFDASLPLALRLSSVLEIAVDELFWLAT